MVSIRVILSGLALLVLLVFSGFFSGSETAFFSLNHIEKEKLRRKSKGRLRHFVAEILGSPDKLLVTVLTGNMLVNLLFASLMDRLVARFVENEAWLVSILIGTILVLIFGEMTPKNIAIRHSLPFFSASTRPLFFIHLFLMPFRSVVQRIERGIVAFITGKMAKGEEDIKQLLTSALRVAYRKGIIHVSELSIIDSFMAFREKTADELMVPRTELQGLPAETRLDDAWEELRKAESMSLLPLYQEDLDHLVGYLQLGDLLPVCYGLEGDAGKAGSGKANAGSVDAGSVETGKTDSVKTLENLMKPIHPVPEKKNVLDLFREMRRLDREMAVVVDEYGGTAGIITFQNLIENFLEFYYPTQEDGLIKVSDGTFRVPGQYDLDDLSELVGREFPSDSRTVAGLMIDQLGEIPPQGARIELSGVQFLARRVSQRKIIEVEVRVPG